MKVHNKSWSISPELMAEYRDGSHTREDSGGLYWQNKNGEWHRDGDRPAIIWAENSSLFWCQHGQLHRRHGPSVIYLDGALEWWWLGKRIPVSSQEAFIAYLEEHHLTEKTKMITASEAYSISRNKVLETRIPQLEEKIRERAEQGYFKTILTRDTWDPPWGPMIDEIKALGYEVHTISNNQILVDWSKR